MPPSENGRPALAAGQAFQRMIGTTSIKALNDRKKVSSYFNKANDAFIDAVLAALQAGEIPLDLARAYLAHPVAMMHASGRRLFRAHPCVEAEDRRDAGHLRRCGVS